MLATTLNFALLAVGALAASVTTADKSKPFKIGVTFPGSTETLYLTNTATASSNIADGIECTIATKGGSLDCGPDKKAFTYSEMHTLEPLKPVASDNKNVNWSIGADNTISWGALPAGTKSVAFSRQKGGNPKNIYAEVCTTYDHHSLFPGTGIAEFWQRGVAKVYFV